MNKKIHNISILLKSTLSIIIVFGVLSCSKEEEEPPSVVRARQDVEAIQKYIEANQIDAIQGTHDYYYYLTQESSDPEAVAPAPGNIVEIYYRMFLLDGTEIASYTAENGAPIKFRHGANAIFPFGIDYALQHIKKGETHRALLTSSLAFYDYSNAALPQYSNMIIEIELVDILSSTQQREVETAAIEQFIADNELGTFSKFTSGLQYKVLEEGDGSIPTRGNRVSVAYVGSLLDGTIFDESKEGEPIRFILGANPAQVIQGWEQGIPLMQKGETAKLMIPSHLAYDESFQVVPNSFRDELIDGGYFGTNAKANRSKVIPPFATLIFDVTLIDIE